MPQLNFFPLVANGYSCLPSMTPNAHSIFFSVIIMVVQEMILLMYMGFYIGLIVSLYTLGFLDSSNGKQSACNTGDQDLIP